MQISSMKTKDRSDISLCSRLAQQSRVTSQSLSFNIAMATIARRLTAEIYLPD
jgi:hypothetical protein